MGQSSDRLVPAVLPQPACLCCLAAEKRTQNLFCRAALQTALILAASHESCRPSAAVSPRAPGMRSLSWRMLTPIRFPRQSLPWRRASTKLNFRWMGSGGWHLSGRTIQTKMALTTTYSSLSDALQTY